MKKIRDLRRYEDFFHLDKNGRVRSLWMGTYEDSVFLYPKSHPSHPDPIGASKMYPIDQVNMDLMVYTKDEVELVNGKYKIKEGI